MAHLTLWTILGSFVRVSIFVHVPVCCLDGKYKQNAFVDSKAANFHGTATGLERLIRRERQPDALRDDEAGKNQREAPAPPAVVSKEAADRRGSDGAAAPPDAFSRSGLSPAAVNPTSSMDLKMIMERLDDMQREIRRERQTDAVHDDEAGMNQKKAIALPAVASEEAAERRSGDGAATPLGPPSLSGPSPPAAKLSAADSMDFKAIMDRLDDMQREFRRERQTDAAHNDEAGLNQKEGLALPAVVSEEPAERRSSDGVAASPAGPSFSGLNPAAANPGDADSMDFKAIMDRLDDMQREAEELRHVVAQHFKSSAARAASKLEELASKAKTVDRSSELGTTANTNVPQLDRKTEAVQAVKNPAHPSPLEPKSIDKTKEVTRSAKAAPAASNLPHPSLESHSAAGQTSEPPKMKPKEAPEAGSATSQPTDQNQQGETARAGTPSEDQSMSSPTVEHTSQRGTASQDSVRSQPDPTSPATSDRHQAQESQAATAASNAFEKAQDQRTSQQQIATGKLPGTNAANPNQNQQQPEKQLPKQETQPNEQQKQQQQLQSSSQQQPQQDSKQDHHQRDQQAQGQSKQQPPTESQRDQQKHLSDPEPPSRQKPQDEPTQQQLPHQQAHQQEYDQEQKHTQQQTRQQTQQPPDQHAQQPQPQSYEPQSPAQKAGQQQAQLPSQQQVHESSAPAPQTVKELPPQQQQQPSQVQQQPHGFQEPAPATKKEVEDPDAGVAVVIPDVPEEDRALR